MKYLIGLAIVALGIALSAGAANAQGTWNAIALDFEGGYNLVTGADSEEAANQQALDECGKAECQSVFATESLCLAVADTPEGNYQYGWSYGNTEKGVWLISLGYCIESGFSGCKTLISQCIVPGEASTDSPPQTDTNTNTKTKG